MAFPASTVTVPTLTSLQASFNGLTFGATTNFELEKVEGLDSVSVRTQDPDKPRSRGQFAGLDLPSGRDITFSGNIAAVTGTSFATGLANLSNVLVPRGAVEDPLFIHIGGTTYVCMARMRRQNVPVDVSYVLGNLAQNVAIQFHATDPYIYSTPTQAATVTLPNPTGGFKFNLKFNLTFGGGSSGNSVTVTNNGNVECYPVLTITGPCNYPIVTNVTTGQSLQFNVAMATGDKLVVQTDSPHSATYFVAGSPYGASRLYTLSASSSWFNLAPANGPNALNSGNSTIQFSSSDTAQAAGSLQIQYASAYSSIV